MHKQYPKNQSPLYKIKAKHQLEKRLGVKLSRIPKLLSSNCYRVFKQNDREIQHPIGFLNQLHKKIASLLAKIETPSYVYHKQGRSHVLNANEHKGHHPLIKTDISNYFPSVSREQVKKMFINEFDCEINIARILADICCYKGEHIPTGSPISGYLSFLVNQSLFDEVYIEAENQGFMFTLYVDDLTISGHGVSKNFLVKVKSIIKKHGLIAKSEKTKLLSKESTKIVTGVAIKNNDCLLPNARHKSIADTKRAIASSSDAFEKTTLKKSLKGKISAFKQIQDVNEGNNISYSKLIYSE